MSFKEDSKDFEFVCYERYHGGPEEVKKQMETCPRCGVRLCFSHRPDGNSLLIEESARCVHCDYGSKSIIHTMN